MPRGLAPGCSSEYMLMMTALLVPGARRRSLRRFALLSLFALCAGVAMLVAGWQPARAQSLSYSRGQNISPAYEGWEVDPDGSRYFLFGYMNRNWEEEIDVPVGPNNGFAPGSADQGQPTHFLPRRNRFVFRVAVPKTFTGGRRPSAAFITMGTRLSELAQSSPKRASCEAPDALKYRKLTERSGRHWSYQDRIRSTRNLLSPYGLSGPKGWLSSTGRTFGVP